MDTLLRLLAGALLYYRLSSLLVSYYSYLPQTVGFKSGIHRRSRAGRCRCGSGRWCCRWYTTFAALGSLGAAFATAFGSRLAATTTSLSFGHQSSPLLLLVFFHAARIVQATGQSVPGEEDEDGHDQEDRVASEKHLAKVQATTKSDRAMLEIMRAVRRFGKVMGDVMYLTRYVMFLCVNPWRAIFSHLLGNSAFSAT